MPSLSSSSILLSVLVSSCCALVACAPNEEETNGAAPSHLDLGNGHAQSDQESLEVDLGSAQSDQELEFELPAGTTGFTIVVQGDHVGANDYIGVKELHAPNGDAVVTDFKDARHPDRFLTGTDGSGFGITRVPLVDDDAPRTRIQAGRWKVRFGGTTTTGGKGASTSRDWSGRTHGRVLLQTSHDGAFHGGTFDLDLYVPDGLEVGDGKTPVTVSAATAGNNAYLRERIDGAFALFHRLWGLDRGDVRFHQLPSSLKTIVGQDAINAANRLATFHSTHPSAQIILTNHLMPDGENGGEISGISNCLPGAVGVPGTACSAVIVSMRGGDSWVESATIVHELGHFVGLEHTTEFGGGTDSLADTPVCQNSDDKNALHACADKNNIMFPSANTADSESAIWASNTQKALVHTSPIYRAH